MSNNRKNDKSIRSKVMDATKMAKDREREEQRERDYNTLILCCDALNQKIDKIYQLRSEKPANAMTKEDNDFCHVTNSDILDYFKSKELDYKNGNKIITLIGVMIDLARCQVNTKLTSNHVAIRLIYFMEKFQAYFGSGYDIRKTKLPENFPYLFNSWGISAVGLEERNSTTDAVEDFWYDIYDPSMPITIDDTASIGYDGDDTMPAEDIKEDPVVDEEVAATPTEDVANE